MAPLPPPSGEPQAQSGVASGMSPAPASPRRRRWPYVVGGVVVLVGVGVALFDWDWFKPLVERQAGAAIGRKVSIGHMHVHLARVPRLTFDDVTIANPEGWPTDGPGNPAFAHAEQLAVDVDAMAYLKGRRIVVPMIALQKPMVEAARLADGKANWALDFGSSNKNADTPGPQIGTLRITDGQVHVVDAKLATDMAVAVATRDVDGKSEIVADAKGTYARQPITAQFVGASLLSLQDRGTPYPVNLKVQNGGTRITLVGTVQDPVAFKGADLRLELTGQDMSALLPLTGVAIPQTPPYSIAGKLDYDTDAAIRFNDFVGKVGSTDLSGTIAVDPRPARPVVTADLRSKLVDLDDLGGFIGGTPGRTSTPGQTPAQRQQVARAEASSKLLPDAPINLPKLNAADVHLTYKGDRLRGRGQPLDNIGAKLDIVDGAINLHPLTFGVGNGQIRATIGLAQKGSNVAGKADVAFDRLDISRLLGSTGVARGAGVLGGQMVLEGEGNSVAQLIGTGTGQARLFVRGGANVSALVVDLAGLQLGNALLSALGIPDRAVLQCMAADIGLARGIANIRTFIVDTAEARITAKGDANVRAETLNFQLESEGKHFSVGNFPTPINVTGSFKSPSVRPEVGPLAARAGAAVGLGILLTPLGALLPTIDFGTGEDNACARLLQNAQQPVRAAPPAGKATGRSRAPASRH